MRNDRTKKKAGIYGITALFAAACLFSSAVLADDEIIPQEEIKADSVNYETAEVTYGDVTTPVSGTGYEYYPMQQTILYEGETCLYVGTVAERGQYVEKGDPLFEIEMLFDDVALEELELSLTREKEDFETQKTAIQTNIDDLFAEREAYASVYGIENTTYQKQTIRIQQELLRQELYIFTEEKNIADAEKHIEERKNVRDTKYIYAPSAGTVSDLIYFKPGDRIRDGEMIAIFRDESMSLIKVNDGNFRFGSEVTVTIGGRNNQKSYPGVVVASSQILPGNGDGFALVELEDKLNPVMLSGGRWVNIVVEGSKIDLRNVLVIPNSARVTEDQRVYVTKLDEDGTTHRRYIGTGLNSRTDTWVLTGLSEGDIVILN